MEKSIRPYIFISYAHKDNQMVLPLIEDLKARGFNVWYDAGIEAGTEWPEYIGTKVFYCNCMIFFVSQNSADSSNCRREVDFAVALEKKVLAIRLVDDSELHLSPGLQMTLNNKQAMFFSRSPSKEAFMENLSQAEILKECRITDQWDTLYAKDDELLPEFEESALSPLKAPKERSQPDLEKARSKAEREFLQGNKLESEGAWDRAFACYDTAAKQGHPEAMFRLAECLHLGRGTQKNDKEAYLWYQRAGEHGVTGAMLQQAKHFELTNGTQKGREKAALLLSIAARLNNTEAMYDLGMLYLQNGQSQEQRDEGIAWLEAAAKREHADAMYQLGVFYRENSQEETSLRWLDAAAYWRHPDAIYALAQYWEQKEKAESETQSVWARLSGKQGKQNESEKWYVLAAQHGHLAAADWVCGRRPDVSAADVLAAYQACAEKGHGASMYQLAEAYKEGRGTEKDPVLAAQWYRKAAEAGDRDAMYAWAECCFYGNGTQKNYEEAFAFYEKSSYEGVYAALGRLAECYCKGLGTAQNEKMAFEYARRVEYEGSYYAKEHFELSKYYALGIGTPKNPEKAYEHCGLAAEGDLPEACLQLARYYETGFGTEEDQKRAAIWYRNAAHAGVEEAMLEIAYRYAVGYGVEKTPEEAYAWYQSAAAKEDRWAQIVVAVCMIQGFGTMRNENVGLQKLVQLAEIQEDPQAALLAANIFHQHEAVYPAMQFYLIAAVGGSDEAMEKLGHARYRKEYWRSLVWLTRYLRAKKAHKANRRGDLSVVMPWEEQL